MAGIDGAAEPVSYDALSLNEMVARTVIVYIDESISYFHNVNIAKELAVLG
jgi:hypothetical protein